MRDLAHMRIDTAEALIELNEFVQEATFGKGESAESYEDAFWNL